MLRESIEVLRQVDDGVGRAGSLAAIGSLLLEEGKAGEAAPVLREALDLAREYEVHDTVVLAAVTLACAGGLESGAALAEYLRHEGRLRHATRMEALYILYRTTGDRGRLDEAYRHLLTLRDHAPPEYRESILTEVPIHREIVAAAAAGQAK